jgi:hypothetical protein
MAIKFLSGLNLSNVTAGSILKLDSNGNIVAATAGTDYATSNLWTTTNNGIYYSDDVRIGTYSTSVAPSAKLHVFDYQTTDPKLLIEDGNTGDASMEFKISTQSYTMGIDNSDSDKFVLAASTALGTTNVLEISTTGAPAFQGDLLVNGKYYLSNLWNISAEGASYAKFSNWVRVSNTGFYTTEDVYMDLDDSSSRFVIRGLNNTEHFIVDTGTSKVSIPNWPLEANDITQTASGDNWYNTANVEYNQTGIKLSRANSGYVSAAPYKFIGSFTASVSFKTTNCTHLGIIFAALESQPDNNNYAVILRNNGSNGTEVRVQKRVGGSQSYPISAVNVTSDCDDGNWHELTVSYNGKHIVVDIDGTNYFNQAWTDTTFTSSGLVGLAIYDGTCQFNDFQVTETPSTTTFENIQLTGSTEPQLVIKNPVSSTGNAVLKFEEGSGSTQNATITFNQAGQNNLTIATGYQSATDENLIHLAPAGNIGLTVRGGTGSNDGNVGIGTTSASYKLDVAGDIRSTGGNLRLEGVFPRIYLTDTNNNSDYSIFNGNGTLRIYDDTNSADRFAINSTGNVGIGTTSPSAKLHVNGNVLIGTNGADETDNPPANFADLHIHTLANGQPIAQDDAASLVISTGANQTGVQGWNGTLWFGNSDYPAAGNVNNSTGTQFNYKLAGIGSYASTDTGSSNTGSGDLRFFTTSDASSPSEKMIITTSGNVGVGTGSPSTRFSVRATTATHQLVSINRANSDTAALYLGNNSSNDAIISGNNAPISLGKDVSGTYTEYVGIATDGELKFSAYGAGILKTNASGIVSVDTSTYVTDVDWSDIASINGTININSTTQIGQGDTETLVSFQNSGTERGRFEVDDSANSYFVATGFKTSTASTGFLKADGTVDTGDFFSGAYADLTGTPTLGTMAAANTSDYKDSDTVESYVAQELTGYATETYVGTQISNLVDSAPGTLDTLNELAAALGDDANFSTTVTNSIATKLPLAGGTMSGDLSFEDSNGNTRLTIGNITGSPYEATINSSNYHLVLQAKGTGQGQIRFNTGTTTATEKMRILENGNVGIGTTSPDFNLDTRISRASGAFLSDGQVYALGLQNTDTTAGNATAMAFGHGGYNYTNFIASIRTGTGANPKGDLAFGGRPTDGATFLERMRIKANGNVGIGTTSPGSTLSVNGTNTGSVPLLDLTASGSGAFQRGVRMLNAGMSAGDSIMMAVGNRDNSKNMGQFYFYYAGNASNSNRISMGLHSVDDVFNILATGNVGIGTTAPSQKLDVSGNAYVSGYVQAGTALMSNKVISSSDFATFGSNASTRGIALSRDFNPSVYPDLIINSSGNVGLGTASPGYKLEVAGVVQGFGAVRVNSTSTGSPYFGLYQNGSEKAYIQYVDNGDSLVLQSDGEVVIRGDVQHGQGDEDAVISFKQSTTELGKFDQDGYIYATGFKTSTASTGFLKADGSVDTSTYASSTHNHNSDYVAIAGGYYDSDFAWDGTHDFQNEIKVSGASATTTNTTALFYGASGLVEKRGLGTAAFSATGDFAAASHTHSYLPLAGGTLTGDLLINTGTNGSTTQAYSAFDSLQFNNQYSSVAAGPNKIVMYDDGGSWVGGFGIHDDTTAYYSGGTHKWYKTATGPGGPTFTQKMSLDASGNLVTTGTLTSTGATLSGALTLSSGDLFVPGYIRHYGDNDTHILFTNNRIQIAAGGTVKFDSNNTYLTSETDTFASVTGRGASTTTSLSIRNLTSRTIVPETDRTYNLGAEETRWAIVYCETLDSAGQHESQLQNPEGEKSIGDYATGTVLVWKGGKNIPCTEAADHMRMGIAVNGVDSPLVQGAEPVLVTGSVNEGDYLVTSSVEGHAKAITPQFMRQHMLFDCVIGKALESGEGDSHLIKTWINI